MELKSCLRRTQSLKSVTARSDNRPIWAEGARRDRMASVSQLVARYQNSVEVSTTIEVTQVNNPQTILKQVPQETKTPKTPKTTASAEVSSRHESKAESLPKKAGAREWSLPHTKTNLARSRSMGSLKNCFGSVSDLKSLFESKNDMQPKILHERSMRAEGPTLPIRAKTTDATPVVNGHAGERQPAQKKKAAPSADSDGHANVDAKANDVKANAHTKEQELIKKQQSNNKERGKSIGGIDLERVGSSHYDDKKRSFSPTRETLPISVKAISALYLSQTRATEQRNNTTQLAKEKSESAKRTKPIKSRWPRTVKEQKTLWCHHVWMALAQEGVEEISLGGTSKHLTCHRIPPK
ncbi:LIM domain-containing protein isoform X2 [Gadus macrocephalus]|uniref:LIM domain-containing protein isoform X2 n=1 Tax=Gadus macrocephalus TaxID=80720 RepID=UPI0028CB3ECC|nr:LIM domain-containing protein isoform X2 [Gadus macrocephalus]